MGARVTRERELVRIAQVARPYPVDLLEGCETGLVLFAAAFLGVNDAVHFAEAGLETTCVDTDLERLTAMAQLYPRSWRWHPGDAWEYAAKRFERGDTFDAVSVDTFTGDAELRSLASLDLWTGIANRVVTVTLTGEPPPPPEGWKDSLFERADGVYWLVLERGADA
jgi:hypothetical protein